MCDSCGWEELEEIVDDQLNCDPLSLCDEAVLWAIYDWIGEHDCCTDAQRTAVENIVSKGK